MPDEPDNKRAVEDLEAALAAFDRGDFNDAIRLAARADRVFEALLTRQGRESSLTSLAKAAAEIHERLFGEKVDVEVYRDLANRAANALGRSDAEGSPAIIQGAQQHAGDLLKRAIDDYWLLEQSMTPPMESFIRKQHGPSCGPSLAKASTSARGAPVTARSTAAIRSRSASGRARKRASSVMSQDQPAPSIEPQRTLADHCLWWPIGAARPCYEPAKYALVRLSGETLTPNCAGHLGAWSSAIRGNYVVLARERWEARGAGYRGPASS